LNSTNFILYEQRGSGRQPLVPNISTPGFRLDIDIEIQGIEIEADWGGNTTDLGDFSFDFSTVDIRTDSIN
jgi:hypothetical protein